MWFATYNTPLAYILFKTMIQTKILTFEGALFFFKDEKLKHEGFGMSPTSERTMIMRNGVPTSVSLADMAFVIILINNSYKIERIVIVHLHKTIFLWD